MKRTILQSCIALLMFALTGRVALGQTPITISVAGGGTFTYLYTNEPETCYQGGTINYSDYLYGGSYPNAFAYKSVGGQTTNFATTQLLWVDSPGGSSCPPNAWNPASSITLPLGSLGTVTFNAIANTAVLTPPPPQPVWGYVNPKYIIMGVTYAPPGGSPSFVSYGDSNFVGNTASNSSSFSQNYSSSVSLSGGVGCPGTGSSIMPVSGGACVTGTNSNSWTMASNSSNTVTVSTTTAQTMKTPGVPTIYSPVDHDYDIIWLWLNPAVTFNVPTTNTSSGGSITWTGYAYDYTDPVHAIDIWPIYVGYLNGHFGALDPQDADALARSWVTTQTFAPGQGPGITSADYPNILGADPFAANPAYLVTLESGTNPLTTTDKRYTQAGVNGVAPQSVPYKQAPPNSTTGDNETYQNTYTQSSSYGEGASYTYTTGFGLEEKFGGSFFGIGVSYDFKQNWQFTWMNTWQNTITNTTSTTDTLSVTGPPCPALVAPCNPEYTEPHEFAVYEDNLYGTFMLFPNPYFSLGTVTPASLTVQQGGSGSYTMPSAANAGYTGTLTNFSVTGLPSGAAAAVSPKTGAAGTTFTLAVTTTTSTPVGTYPLTISATDGSLSYFTYSTLVVSPEPTFSLSATPGSQTVVAGAQTTYTVSTSTTSGFTGVVGLTVSGLPGGSTSAFNPPSITGIGSSTLTVATSTSTAPGKYTLTITGVSENQTETATITLVVPTPTFSIVISPGTQTITAGNSTTYTVAASAVNGFSGSVTLSTGTLPSGISATFSPNPVAAGSSSTMTISSTASAAVGTYSLPVNGTSGSLTNTANPSPILIVNPVPPNFSVAATPSSSTVVAGAKATYTFTTTAINGFTGVVSLSASGLPTGATAAFSPTSITGSGSSTLTVTTSTSTPAGTYTLTLTGVSGSLTSSAKVTMVVRTQSFSIAVSPSSATAAIGSAATYTVTTTALNGFDGIVTLSVVTPPSNSSVSFSPATITGSGSSKLTITTTGNTLPGTYTFSIKGTSGSLTATTTATLVVTGTNFTLSASPETETVTAGGSTTYTVKAAGVSGFTGTIALSLPGLPAGASATFNPTSIAGSGESTLTITTSTSTAAGEYYLYVTGTSGTLTETTEIILHVDN
jgi:uncharacterized membrane protein